MRYIILLFICLIGATLAPSAAQAFDLSPSRQERMVREGRAHGAIDRLRIEELRALAALLSSAEAQAKQNQY